MNLSLYNILNPNVLRGLKEWAQDEFFGPNVPGDTVSGLALDVDTSYANIARVASERTDEELLAEREWMARRMELDAGPYNSETRVAGDLATMLVLYVLTGTPPNKKPFGVHDMPPVLNLYALAPPHVKKILDPIVSEWKTQVYRDPDVMMAPEDDYYP